MKKTYWPKKELVKRNWHVVDAKGKVLGRIATEIARLLIGKHKPSFTPAVDEGDFVIVLNADDCVLTGTKSVDKVYYWHTGYPSGLRSSTPEKLKKEKPGEVLRNAIYGMLPKNKLRDHRMTRLKVYSAADHPHVAQMPRPAKF